MTHRFRYNQSPSDVPGQGALDTHDDQPRSDHVNQLDIGICEELIAPTAEHNLLLGFNFGTSPSKDIHPAIASPQLQPLDRDRVIESWWYRGAVQYSRSGSVRLAECQDYTAAIIELEAISAERFREQTRQAYLELIKAVRSTKHGQLVKIWNYFDDINAGEGDFEKYRQFSMGRAETFHQAGIRDENAPTGTAIGSRSGSGLTIIALASNRNFNPVENPRQVSAFRYPREYGPRSPKFSRGGFVSAELHTLFLISGTAAVVGHVSNFPYKTSLQLDETFKNLAQLCEEISSLTPAKPIFALDDKSVLRVYLKNPDDYDLASKKLEKVLKRGKHNVIFLHGTICRKELTVEIDGIKVV